MKQVFLMTCAAFCAALLFCACGDAGKRTIVISIPSADHGWTGGIVSWAENAEKEIEKNNPDVDVIVQTSKDSQEQANGIETMLAKGIDTLVILPHEPAPLTNISKKAKKQGVFLVVVDRGLAEPVYDFEVVGDNTGFGEAAARAIGRELNGKGEIVIMEGIQCQVNTDRVNGFKTVLAKEFPGIRILQSTNANWSEEEGMKVMENMLSKFNRIDAVWTGDDDVLNGALKAYEKSGRSDVKLMVGGGGSKTVVKRVLDGDPLVRLTVTYPPKMIYDAALMALEKQALLKKVVIPAEIVEKTNAAKFYYPDSRY